MNKITKKEIEIAKKPSELYEWFFNTLDKFKSREEIESVRIKNYQEIKVFMEESYPLAIFCKYYFQIDNLVCIKQQLGINHLMQKLKIMSMLSILKLLMQLMVMIIY